MEVSRCGETRESLGDDDRVVAPSPAISLAERDQFRRGDGTGFGGGEYRRPRLEQVVRRLDAPGTEVALALPIQFPGIGETDANAGDFDLPRDDQRFFDTERAHHRFAETTVVSGAPRPKQVRRAAGTW